MKKIICLILFFLLIPGIATSQKALSVKDLPEQYRDWLKLVAYLIQPVERDVFMKLTTNRDRDIFVEAFWKQRDPTVGTPENEYKDEIVKRFNHVNQTYGRSSVREGWQTDMGRIYMILGAPTSIERFDTSSFVHPCQAWTYYGDTSKGLPNLFNLLFFQRGSVGDYKLYDPVSDGPARLLVNPSNFDPMNYEELHDHIREIAPTLADLSLTMIPGEYNPDFSPSPRNLIILADILQSPKKDVNPAYATHFLDYKGYVSTDYMTNFVDSHAATAVIQDPMTGIRFVHFSIAPVTASVEFYEPKGQHYCNYQVNASLRSGDDIVFQYTRDFPVYFGDDEVARIQANGIAVEDSFPVAEGKYRLVILLTNSVGKEFSLLEKDIEVPADSGLPRIAGPFLGYRFETYRREVHIPFKVLDKKLVVDPKKTFGASDEVAIFFSVLDVGESLRRTGEARITVRGLREANPVLKSYTVKLATQSPGPNLAIPYSIPARELEPDYYEVVVALADGDRILDEKKETFVLSGSAALGHPIANAKSVTLKNQFIYHYMLAQQAENTGRTQQALAHYQRAYALSQDYHEGIVKYANFLIKTGSFDEALTLVERLGGDENLRFEYSFTRGRALMGKEQFADALASLLEANKIYNSDIQVLNALGLCYHRTGQKQKALDALNASLKLNPNQEEVKKLVAEIGK